MSIILWRILAPSYSYLNNSYLLKIKQLKFFIIDVTREIPQWNSTEANKGLTASINFCSQRPKIQHSNMYTWFPSVTCVPPLFPAPPSPATMISAIKCTKRFHVLQKGHIWVVNTLWLWCWWRVSWFWHYNGGSSWLGGCCCNWDWWLWLCFWGSSLSPHSNRCRNLCSYWKQAKVKVYND